MCDFYSVIAFFHVTSPYVHASHLKLIEKLVVDFLLVLIELFFASCYG